MRCNEGLIGDSAEWRPGAKGSKRRAGINIHWGRVTSPEAGKDCTASIRVSSTTTGATVMRRYPSRTGPTSKHRHIGERPAL